jgi:hypothetical protein
MTPDGLSVRPLAHGEGDVSDVRILELLLLQHGECAHFREPAVEQHQVLLSNLGAMLPLERSSIRDERPPPLHGPKWSGSSMSAFACRATLQSRNLYHARRTATTTSPRREDEVALVVPVPSGQVRVKHPFHRD